MPNVDIINRIAEILFRKKSGLEKYLPAAANKNSSHPMLQIYTAIMYFFSFSSKTIQSIMPNYLERLKQLVLNSQETLHYKALKVLCDIDFVLALDCYIELVKLYPEDKVAILMLETCAFLSGKIDVLSEPYHKLMQYYENDPDFLGNLAFLYCHINKSEEAKLLVERGLKLDPHNAWLQHVFAHTIDDRTIHELRAGINFLENHTEDWPKQNRFFEGHNWLHLCMLYLKAHQHRDIILHVFPMHIWGKAKECNFEQNNAFLTLWYAELAGCKNIPKTWWEDLAKYASNYTDDYFTPYLTITSILSVAKADRRLVNVELNKFEKHLETISNDSDKYIAWNNVGLSALKGCLAYIDGKYDDAISLLKPICYDTRLLGHSDEQRGIFLATFEHAEALYV